jgi:hypothetical protein
MHTDGTQLRPEAKGFSLHPVTQQRIGAAFEVHNVLGFGFQEKVDQRATQAELPLRGPSIHLGCLINSGRERVEYKRMVR